MAAGVPQWAAGLAGTAYRRDGAVVLEERRARVRDVDAIPAPAWDLFDVKGYDEHGLVTGIHRGVTVPILATRGCPYRCAYCSSPNMWTTKWVARDPRLVADEIEGYVREYGASNFPFHDLTAILRREWVLDFCREIVARGLKINWQLPSGTRCEVVDHEVGALVDYGNSEQLADAVIELWRHPPPVERLRGRAEHFSFSRFQDRLRAALPTGLP